MIEIIIGVILYLFCGILTTKIYRQGVHFDLDAKIAIAFIIMFPIVIVILIFIITLEFING